MKSADFFINVDRGILESLFLVYDLDDWAFSNRKIKENSDPFEYIKKRVGKLLINLLIFKNFK